MGKLIIAIDGPAGSGKSTVAKAVAQALNYTYIDTGAMYRAIALYVLRQGIEPSDSQRLKEELQKVRIEWKPPGDKESSPEFQGVYLNGEDVTKMIRSPEVSQLASVISTLPEVREVLTQKQREMGREGGVVAEGRDIGTVVFPEAQVKIYLTASLEERARRRAEELSAEQGVPEASLYEKVYRDLAERDYRDSTRSIAPLVRAPDAVEIQTDGLTVEEVTARVLDLVRERKARC